MALPIALQLYTVRENLAKDFEGTIRKVADIGYKNVEFAGFYDRKPADIRKLLDDLGLKAVSAHVGFSDDPKNIAQNVEAAKTIGYDVVVSGLPDGKMRESAEGYRKAVKVLGKAAAALAKEGLTYAYHNHSFEYDTFGDTTGMNILFEESNPPLASELDVYWVKHGHADPIDWMKKLTGRVPLLHIKDMDNTAERKFCEVGTGILDMKAIVKAAPGVGARYLIVEQDAGWIDGDPLKSVKVSFDNLTKIVAQA